MISDPKAWLVSAERLLAVIQTQTQISRVHMDLAQVMDFVAQKAQELIGCDGGIVELVEQDELVYRAATGKAKEHLGLRVTAQGSLSDLCVQTGQAVKFDDSESDPRVDREACRRVGIRSMIAVPLTHEARPVGVLKVFSTKEKFFSESDIHFLELLSGAISAAMAHAVEFSGRKEAVEYLVHRATHDPLTGLANRALFYDRFRLVLSMVKRRKSQLAIVVLDLDGLKAINDSQGHRAGDAVIKAMGASLLATLRESDVAARLGSDEFAVLLTEVANSTVAKEAWERILRRVERTARLESDQVALKCSSGIAIFPDDGAKVDTLVEVADRRMYEYKRARKKG